MFQGKISLVFVIFFIMFLGLEIGKIKVKGISFNASGVLLVSVIVGVLIEKTPELQALLDYDNSFVSGLKLLSSLGVSLFIAAIAITAGSNLLSLRKSDSIVYFSVGILTVLSNLFIIVIILLSDYEINTALLYGTFCGAMTSTPGLTVLCGNSDIASVYAPIGYGSSYLFGVVGTVLFVQLFKKRQSVSPCYVDGARPVDQAGAAADHLIQIVGVIVLGQIVGSIEIPLTHLSFGTVGGILAVGLIAGLQIARQNPCRILSNEQSGIYRSLGLMFFFVGAGIPAGRELLSCFQLKYFVYGIILTVFPLAFCAVIAKYVLKAARNRVLSIVCGAMTSTPAFGALVQDNITPEDQAAYSLTYSGALLAMLFSMKLFYIT